MIAFSLPYHLAHLSAFCEAHRAARKVVFVPSRQIGHNLGNALAAAGISWVNLHLTTPEDAADRLVAPRLRAAGWKPLVQDVDFFFVQKRVREIDWPPEHPYASGFAADGVARTFLKTLRMLRSAAIEPEQVESARVRNGPVIGRIYRSYVSWMTENRLYDRTRLFIDAARVCNGTPDGVFAILDETELSAPAARFVRAVSGGAIVRVGRTDYDVSLPDHSAARRFPGAPLLEAGAGNVHAFGRLTGSGLTAEDSDAVCLRQAVGVENEVRGVLRELIAGGVRLDEVELAYTTADPYLPVVVDAADRLGLPLSAAEGVPITCTNAGQALLGFYRWAAGGCNSRDLVRLCRSRLLRRRKAGAPSPYEIARVMEDARVGRSGYDASMRRYEDRLSERREGLPDEGKRKTIDRKIERARQARRFLKDLHGLLPGGSTSLRAMCEAGAAFLAGYAPTRTDRDVRAIESMQDRLLELAAGINEEGSTSDLARMLADLLVDHKAEASVAAPQHLYAVPLSRAGYTGRKHVVVVGLAETTFPGVPTEDPILLDDERRLLSRELRLERMRPTQSGWHLTRALGMAPGRVMLTSNRRTIPEGRETYPSALFQQAADQLRLTDVPTYHPVPEADAALERAELALALRRAAGMREFLEARHPGMAHGMMAERERRSPAVGRYDGWLADETPELRPAADREMSVSRLEDLSACPYRYFLRHVLRIRPPDVSEDVPGRWLTPLEFGSLLHAVLKEFMEAVTTVGEPVSADRHAALMEEVLDRLLRDARERIPPSYETGFRVDAARLRRAARIFLNEESRRSAEAVGFEISFGLGESGSLKRPDPVVFEVSDRMRLRLRGVIDRVDRTPEGYEVWDYKSGSTYDYDEFDLLMRGRRLQWALYAHVLQSILDEERDPLPVLRSGYFFTSDREHGLRFAQAPPSKRELASILEPLFELATAGGFLHVQKTNACTFCDYNAVCASERRGERDLEDIIASTPSRRPFLKPLERWMEV